MKSKILHHKLVRDRIPEIIDESGKMHRVRQVRNKELKDFALKKLQEEVQEFVEDPSAEEAADVLEIFNFICGRQGLYPHTIEAERTSKRILRGGFEMGYILEWVEDE